MSLLSSVASLIDVFGYVPEDSIKSTMDPTKLNMMTSWVSLWCVRSTYAWFLLIETFKADVYH